MPDATEELSDGVVFRLIKQGPTFPPGAEQPLEPAFSFSGDEVEDAKKTGKWWFSVWDRARTTPDQARAHISSPGKRVAFGLNVAAVRAIRVPEPPEWRLRVFRDPWPSQLPGSDSHCAIDGLRHQKSDYRKLIRSRLAEIAFKLEE